MRRDLYKELFDAGHLAYQLGHACEDREGAWKDGWYKARDENLHLEEEWASLEIPGHGHIIRRKVIEGEQVF